MAKLDNKKALVGLGVLGVAGLAGAAFAASVTLPQSNAGQGVDVVEGYTVTKVEYDSSDLDADATTATVDEVEFDIAADGTGQNEPVDSATSGVYVQLRDGTANSDWVECVATAGHAVCDTSAVDDTINMENIDGISVVAFDDLDA